MANCWFVVVDISFRLVGVWGSMKWVDITRLELASSFCNNLEGHNFSCGDQHWFDADGLASHGVGSNLD